MARKRTRKSARRSKRSRSSKTSSIRKPPGRPPKKPPESGGLEGGNNYDLCDEDERRRFFRNLRHIHLQLRRDESIDITNVTIDFQFSGGAFPVRKRFTRLESVEAFLLLVHNYGFTGTRSQRGEHKRQAPPDWSDEGLCQFDKEINIGTPIMSPRDPRKQIGFKSYGTFYG